MNYDNSIFPNINPDMSRENIQIQINGKRITKDQTVPEYLLEFLLVFIGTDENGKSGFNKAFYKDETKSISYTVKANIALKRFIFLNNSKRENRFRIDIEANDMLEKKIKENIKTNSGIDEDTLLDILKELLYGFSAVTNNRGWFAQSLLPVSREVLFPEAMGKKSMRKNLNFDNESEKIDKKFEFKEYNFMAKGGEVYYLHLLQGLKLLNNEDYLLNIDNSINELLDSMPQISNIANFIQGTWNDYLIKEKNVDEIESINNIDKECAWITNRFSRRSVYSVKELNNLLLCDMSNFEKIDLLQVGAVIQILRMMCESSICIAKDKKEMNPMWLIHIQSENVNDIKVKKLAERVYREIEESILISIDKFMQNDNADKDKKSDIEIIKKASEDTYKLIRKVGKDIGLIIPLRGSGMRMTLNDSIIRFLVLSTIEPGKKITLSTFLDKIYNSYGIVIGVEEYIKYLEDNNLPLDNDISFLGSNLLEFQVLLKKNGFLRELSDATSIVQNPYKRKEV